MEELKEQLSKKWYSFNGLDLEKKALIWINRYSTRPFDALPKKEVLTKEELKWLKLTENKGGNWQGNEFLKMSNLRLKNGLHKEVHELRRKNFEQVVRKCTEEKIKLPENFIKFIMTDRIIDKLRCDWSEFVNFHKLVKFPNQNGLYLIPFHEDSQGSCIWYLVIDKKENHFVLFYPTATTFDYEIDFENFKEKILICADNIEEFIIRMSLDFQTVKNYRQK